MRNPQPMAHPRLADVATPTRKALLNTPFGNKPSPLLFRFQAAFGVSQRFRAAAACHQGKPCLASSNCRSHPTAIKRGNSNPSSARSVYAAATPWSSNRAFNNKRQPETENSVFRLPSLQIIQAAQRQPESSTTSNYH